MRIIEKLFDGEIDIIGDIHGEYEALVELIKNLGYDLYGNHKEGRKLVFVGDLCDRGPDSPAVIKLVKTMMDYGNAQAILGNHELNLLQKSAKDGAGWFFEEREIRDKNYEPFQRVEANDKERIYNFLSSLPIVLENDNLRVVHAAWDNASVEKLKNLSYPDIGSAYFDLEEKIDNDITESGLLQRYRDEQKIWHKEMEDPEAVLPYLNATCEYNLAHQMNNPIRVLTSGVEQKCDIQFYASGRWRFVERATWWNNYVEDKPVIVGHFWRKINPEIVSHNGESVFKDVEFNEWHGVKKNVFCVDYSVGARFRERLKGGVGENTHLVALRWPENELMLENGKKIPTINFKSYANKNKM